MNDCIKEYNSNLKKGHIQKAYKSIMTFMLEAKFNLVKKYPDYKISSLYFGYMDMTYFAFTPIELKSNYLKIAIVYLHVENRFEVWLSGVNKKVQDNYIEKLKEKNIGKYKLSKSDPGIDSIIEYIIIDNPDFDNKNELKNSIEEKTIEFIKDIIMILNK